MDDLTQEVHVTIGGEPAATLEVEVLQPPVVTWTSTEELSTDGRGAFAFCRPGACGLCDALRLEHGP